MNKILLISPDKINRKMAGPAIRYLNFAIELSKKFDVTLYIPNKESDMDFTKFSFKVIQKNKSRLKKCAIDSNVIIVQGIAFKVYHFLKRIKIPIVVDIYDPITLENLELRKNLSLKDRINYHNSDLDIVLQQLSIGDYFICASERQKDYWIGMLAALNRINPSTYLDNYKMDKLIGTVPFGLNNKEPIKTKNVLKGVWKGISKDDKVILWGGGIWNWFDPLTLIEAMKIVCECRNDIKLFFMGIGHPNADIDINIAEKCIEISKMYNLYNKNIFFNDWVEYDERQNYLLEADIGISTYYDNLETRYSFRTRILDYMWCELPMILTNGDYMSELVDRYKLGLCHKEKDYGELANCILDMINNIEFYESYKNNICKIKDKYKWENVIEPLVEFCNNPYKSSDKTNKVKVFYSRNALVKFNYYFIRIKSKIKKVLGWKK